MTRHAFWTLDEDRFLIDHLLAGWSRLQIGEHLDRSVSAVATRVFMIRRAAGPYGELKPLAQPPGEPDRPTATGRFRVEEELTILDSLASGLRAYTIAARIGRVVSSVETCIGRMQREDGVGGPWTAQDTETLISLRDRLPDAPRGALAAQIGALMGRHSRSIARRLARMGDRAPSEAPAKASEPYMLHDPTTAQARELLEIQTSLHAEACLAAGGFWSLSERPLGAGKWAVCLPLVPPAQTLRRAA